MRSETPLQTDMKTKMNSAISCVRCIRIELENQRHTEGYEVAVMEIENVIEVLEHFRKVSEGIDRIVNG